MAILISNELNDFIMQWHLSRFVTSLKMNNESLLNMYNKSIYLFGEPSSNQLDDNTYITHYGQSPRTKVTIVMEFSTYKSLF